jgi:hypothetical protein
MDYFYIVTDSEQIWVKILQSRIWTIKMHDKQLLDVAYAYCYTVGTNDSSKRNTRNNVPTLRYMPC